MQFIVYKGVNRSCTDLWHKVDFSDRKTVHCSAVVPVRRKSPFWGSSRRTAVPEELQPEEAPTNKGKHLTADHTVFWGFVGPAMLSGARRRAGEWTGLSASLVTRLSTAVSEKCTLLYLKVDSRDPKAHTRLNLGWRYRQRERNCSSVRARLWASTKTKYSVRSLY